MIPLCEQTRDTIISLQDVTKVYTLVKQNSVTAVSGVSLAVPRGEFVVITGRSGSGKTTLLNLAAGLTRPTSGKVLIEDANLWGMPDKKQSLWRNEKVGFIFQFPSLLSSLTALDNVVLPTMFGASGAKDSVYERGTKLLHLVGLADKLASFPRQLSAGQQQRVVVARALINDPQILIADEPTSDLDEQTETEIMNLLREIHRRTGVTILLVTHATQLRSYGTQAIHMAGGRIVNGAHA